MREANLKQYQNSESASDNNSQFTCVCVCVISVSLKYFTCLPIFLQFKETATFFFGGHIFTCYDVTALGFSQSKGPLLLWQNLRPL